MKAYIGDVYVRNIKFIKIRHTNFIQTLKTLQGPIKDIAQGGPSVRPRTMTRKPQKLIKSMKVIWAQDRRRGLV